MDRSVEMIPDSIGHRAYEALKSRGVGRSLGDRGSNITTVSRSIIVVVDSGGNLNHCQ